MNNKDISKVRELLMNDGNCKFTVKDITEYKKKEDGSYGNVPKVLHTVKIEGEEHCGSISEGWSGMNVNKWGPTCVTLYTYDMLGKRISGKIRYADVRFVVSEEEAYVLSQLETNPLEKLDGFIGTENCPL